MIDYKKLKEAHDLAEKYQQTVNGNVSITVEFCNVQGKPIYELKHIEQKPMFEMVTHIQHSFWGLGDLVEMLKNLSQSPPKYRLDKIVWLYNYHENKIDSFKIDAITKRNLTYSGESCDGSYCYEEVPENDLYSSKEALIEAQLEHWQTARISASTTCKQCGMQRFFGNQCYECGVTGNVPCEHEPISQYLLSDPPQKECKKCGEFYR